MPNQNLKKFDGLMEFPTDHPVEQCKNTTLFVKGKHMVSGKSPSPNSRFQHTSHTTFQQLNSLLNESLEVDLHTGPSMKSMFVKNG